MSNKVTYGLHNVHVWPITETSSDGVPTYGPSFRVPGAVNLQCDPSGNSDSYYADNAVYFQAESNQGYSMTLQVADIPVEFSEKILGETEDDAKVRYEHADVNPSEFAIGFEVEGDALKRRFIFYRCKAQRSSLSTKTKEDSISPNTPELSATAMPRLDTQVVKSVCESDSTAWNEFFADAAPYYELKAKPASGTSGS